MNNKIIICSFDFSLWLVLFAIEGTPDELNGGCKPLNLTHLLLASLGGLLVAAAAFAGESFLHRRKAHQGDSMGNKDQKIAPLIERKDSGRRSNLERFSHYVGTFSWISKTF